MNNLIRFNEYHLNENSDIVNVILDKIAKYGIDGISPTEKRMLDSMSNGQQAPAMIYYGQEFPFELEGEPFTFIYQSGQSNIHFGKIDSEEYAYNVRLLDSIPFEVRAIREDEYDDEEEDYEQIRFEEDYPELAEAFFHKMMELGEQFSASYTHH